MISSLEALVPWFSTRFLRRVAKELYLKNLLPYGEENEY